MASLLIIAACAAPAVSFDGEWKAAAVCVVALVIEFSVLLWQERRHRSLVGRGLLALVAVTGLGTAGLAVFAGLHVGQEFLICSAPLPPDLATAEAQRAQAAYDTLYTVDTLVALAYVATLSLAHQLLADWRRSQRNALF